MSIEKTNVKMIVPREYQQGNVTFFGRYTIGPGQKTIEVTKTYVSDFEALGFKVDGRGKR